MFTRVNRALSLTCIKNQQEAHSEDIIIVKELTMVFFVLDKFVTFLVPCHPSLKKQEKNALYHEFSFKKVKL